ncbi:MAG: fimbria/pilus periplasmic chaperone [Henriciella sp.]|uniref:fimbria/pilus periplasmic chaperone n=1 Tax=Henriciella sp. TaxID=1968823 RepID=UPI003C732263
MNVRWLAISLLLLAATGLAHAARVTPMVVNLDESGSGATARIEVANTEDIQLPMEARVYRGDISEEGKLTLAPADEDFLVFPPQAVIQPYRQQVFRVQYLGDEPLAQSEIYYLALKQVPVELEPGASRIQLIMNFNVLINVVPDGVAAQPAVDWIRPATVDERDGLEVRVENTGTKFFAAGRNQWTIEGETPDGAPYSSTIEPDAIGELIGYGIVPPGKARIFFIPTDRAVNAESASIEFGR